METQETIIVFILGLVFGFISAKWLINWAMTETINKLANKFRKEKENE